jgi:Flp pilus assembly protein TadD
VAAPRAAPSSPSSRRDRAPPIAAPVDRSIVARAAAGVDAGDLAGALALIEPALIDDPLDAAAHLIAGLAHHARGAHGACCERMRAALCLEPRAWIAAFYLALASERLGRWDDARRGYASVQDARGSDDPLARARGRVLDALRAQRRDIEELAAGRLATLDARAPAST